MGVSGGGADGVAGGKEASHRGGVGGRPFLVVVVVVVVGWGIHPAAEANDPAW